MSQKNIYGKFRALEDIMKVKGIGNKMYLKIQGAISIDDMNRENTN